MPEREVIFDSRSGRGHSAVEIENTRTSEVEKIPTTLSDRQVRVERIPGGNGGTDMARIVKLNALGHETSVEIQPLSETVIRAHPRT